MSIRDDHNRKVSFDAKEELGDKIDKSAVMIGKLAARDTGTSRHFKPQIYQIDVEVRTEITIKRMIRTGIDQIMVSEDNTDKIEVALGTNKIIGEEILQAIVGPGQDQEQVQIETL